MKILTISSSTDHTIKFELETDTQTVKDRQFTRDSFLIKYLFDTLEPTYATIEAFLQKITGDGKLTIADTPDGQFKNDLYPTVNIHLKSQETINV